jgi:hypothetical protein
VLRPQRRAPALAGRVRSLAGSDSIMPLQEHQAGRKIFLCDNTVTDVLLWAVEHLGIEG